MFLLKHRLPFLVPGEALSNISTLLVAIFLRGSLEFPDIPLEGQVKHLMVTCF